MTASRLLRCFRFLMIIVTATGLTDTWDGIGLLCPQQCVCEYKPLRDLSIARWIINERFDEPPSSKRVADLNQVLYTDDDEQPIGVETLIKFAMCIIQADVHPKDLFATMPPDVQAIVLLYSGTQENVIITTGDLAEFTELITLELRGSVHSMVTLLLEEPLPHMLHLNLENVQLRGSEHSTRRPNSVEPWENFNYVPDSEKVDYNISLTLNMEPLILPYDVYLAEMKRNQSATFYGWQELTVLRMHACNMDELHWQMFDGLVRLRHLSLEHNGIKIVPPFAFYGALHIRTLSLAYNSILDLHYRALAGLLDLVELDLSNNGLTRLAETTFPPSPRLVRVDIRDNPLRSIFPNTFAVMNNTKVLFLGSEREPLELMSNSLADLERLEQLNVLHLRVPLLRNNIFKGLHSLRKLTIRGELPKIEYDAFVETLEMRELILQQCQIAEISMDSFFGLTQLEIVDLSYNRITFLPPGLFDDKRNLREIYLQNNLLATLPASFFTNLPAKLVRLTDNPWLCSCQMAGWKQSLTNKQRTIVKSTKCDRSEYATLKMSCDNSQPFVVQYQFDNKLSPRCEAGPAVMKDRSVYYALRKQLICTRKREVQSTVVSGPMTVTMPTVTKRLKDIPGHIDKYQMATATGHLLKHLDPHEQLKMYRQYVMARGRVDERGHNQRYYKTKHNLLQPTDDQYENEYANKIRM